MLQRVPKKQPTPAPAAEKGEKRSQQSAKSEHRPLPISVNLGQWKWETLMGYRTSVHEQRRHRQAFMPIRINGCATQARAPRTRREFAQ